MSYIDRYAPVKGDYVQLLGGSHISNRLWHPPKERLKSVQFYGTTTDLPLMFFLKKQIR